MKTDLKSLFLPFAIIFSLLYILFCTSIDVNVIGSFTIAALEIVPVSIAAKPERQLHNSNRRRVLRFWGIIVCTIFVLLGACYTYDRLWDGADRLIGGIAYVNVLSTFLYLAIVCSLLSIGITSRRKGVQNISLSILTGLFFWLLLEGLIHLAFGLNFLQGPPFTFRRFYISSGITKIRPFPAGDLNPIVGRSHMPNGSDKFTNCEGDTLHWTYNSVGAHDQQRQLINPTPTKKRIAVLGDSFMEGYMVNTPDRCSSILEQKTGLEHLNFTVNGSNPVHYYLMYKGVAKAFAPDVLIVGFLPANDFEILNERTDYQRVEYPMYQPYWQGTYPNYTLRYGLANVNQSIFHGTNTQASLLNVVDSVYAALPLVDKLKANILTHSSILKMLEVLNAKRYKEGQFTKYQQFNEEEWHYVSYSLTKLAEEAKGKKVIILSIPTQADLMALKQGKTNRIDPLLANFCRQKGINFIPLAPSFLAYRGNLADLYVSCDGHWSAKGESFAAGTLMNNPVYRSLVGL